MKGYNKPDKLERGTCFICMKPCDFDAYVHSACAYAYLDEKERRIQDAKEKTE